MRFPQLRHSQYLGLAAALIFSATAQAGSPYEGTTLAIGPQLKISHSIDSVDATDIPAAEDIWQRLRQGVALPDTDNALVRVHEQWFANHPAYLDRAMQRSRLYLFHIVEAVEKRGMPMEIALLPVIESGFDPRAESPRQASGLWQFIPSTGKIFGLQQNAWYDGRRDVLQATSAALDYLAKLREMFGDWRLALAAYNCGEGCVSRAIAKNRAQGLATDYDSLALPTETRHYVPKLIAVRNLVMNPERYNVRLASIPNDPYFMRVNLSYPMEAKTAARLAEMEMDEFLALNPAYRRNVIYSDTPGILLLPADRIETFHFNLQRTGKEKARLQTYQASRGELLHKIAERFNVSLNWLKEHNPVQTNKKGKLMQAQQLVLPPAATGKTASKPSKAATKSRTHTVRKGDTLAKLAREYGVRLSDLRQLNQSWRLMPGDTVLLPENS